METSNGVQTTATLTRRYLVEALLRRFPRTRDAVV
jgi:hypothetical protein